MKPKPVDIVIILCGYLFFFALGAIVGGKVILSTERKAAIEAGAAEWRIDQTGKPEFYWRRLK